MPFSSMNFITIAHHINYTLDLLGGKMGMFSRLLFATSDNFIGKRCLVQSSFSVSNGLVPGHQNHHPKMLKALLSNGIVFAYNQPTFLCIHLWKEMTGVILYSGLHLVGQTNCTNLTDLQKKQQQVFCWERNFLRLYHIAVLPRTMQKHLFPNYGKSVFMRSQWLPKDKFPFDHNPW